MKRRLNHKFKRFKRDADKLLNVINEEGNCVDVKDMRRLREAVS